MKTLRKIQIAFTVIKVVLIVLLVLGIILILAVQALGGYVQDNYIKISSNYGADPKKAFIYDYTKVTGDNTIAGTLGYSIDLAGSVVNQPVSNVTFTDSDVRNVSRAITSAWISIGAGNGWCKQGYLDWYNKYVSIIEKSTLYTVKNDFINATEMGTTYKGIVEDSSTTRLYDCDHGDKSYFMDMYGQKFDFKSYRCCCCLAEVFVESMVFANDDRYELNSRSTGHTSEIGMTTEDKAISTKSISSASVSSRLVYNTLYSRTKSNVDMTIDEAIEAGVIGVGSIVTYGDASGNTKHVDIVAYISDTHVYLAGAGDNTNIMMDSIVGYNRIISRSKGLYDGLDSSLYYTLNVIHWTECQYVDEK